MPSSETKALREELHRAILKISELQTENLQLTEECLKSKHQLSELLNENLDLKQQISALKSGLVLPSSVESSPIIKDGSLSSPSLPSGPKRPTTEHLTWSDTSLGEIHCLEPNPLSENSFAISGTNGTVTGFSLDIQSTVRPSPSFSVSEDKSISSICFGGNKLVMGGGTGRAVAVWSTDNHKLLSRFFGHSGKITGIDCSNDGSCCVSGGLDRNIFVWDVERSASRSTFSCNSTINDLVLSGSDVAVVGLLNGVFSCYDLRSSTLICSPDKLHSSRVTAVDVLQQRNVVTLSRDNTLCISDLRTGSLVKRISHPRLRVGTDSTKFGVSLDGKTIAVPCADGFILLIDSTTGEVVSTLNTNTSDCIVSAKFLSNFLVSVSRTGTIVVYK
ncbi:hypothetical protein RCL1_008712 [Eukaryota sp. TZLM3-RCL]